MSRSNTGVSGTRHRTNIPNASDHLAARLARDGDPEPIQIEDTDTTFAIEWKGRYHIEGGTFVYVDDLGGRLTAISGYPTQKLAQLG